MAMDLEDLDIEGFEEPEEGEERQNRTFIILVGLMSGLLLIGIVAFCAWALLVARGSLFGGGAAIAPTATAPVEIAAAETPSPTAVPSPTARPTATPQPSPTPSPMPSPTRPGTPEALAQVTPTIGPERASPTPTAAPETVTQTGVGSLTAVIVGAGLLLLLLTARRLRTAR